MRRQGDLHRYRWHTGAPLRRLDPEEHVGPLFRDVGPDALLAHLEGRMTRLAGPMTPLTYLRTAAWREPYVDHAKTGRLVVLEPRSLGVWHSGVAHIYVAPARRWPAVLGYVPGRVSLSDAAAKLSGARTPGELTEALGAPPDEDRRGLQALVRSRREAEVTLEPLRRSLQSGDERARKRMEALGVDEADLCAAWHHLPSARREHLAALGREGAR